MDGEDGLRWDGEGWCSACVCDCGPTNLYFGEFCEEKHNITFNIAVAFLILLLGLASLPVIFVRGRLAEISANLKV